ncbi:(2Fe-2S) ferredoxin [Agaricicola taiwanensis]|uniref:(2Fe-2S) ferredoxin n=1 Tax=Agaricicola taiwanensis TaxID=591372 RepID=A0A8J2YFQ9_9RHOB|nr:Rieske 2Fe-2S domain-containing protein [Agaricicola taiwanensis]GGE30999.1 (2Fe-2S) ferredoxin [Agaricicola taiwanensis]
MSEVCVGRREDIPDGGACILEVDNLEIGVIHHEGQFYAYRNLCPHQGGPACEGVRMAAVVDDVDAQNLFQGQKFNSSEMHIVCPWHGYEYRLSDGVNVCDARLRLKKFEVTERDGHLYVTI